MGVFLCFHQLELHTAAWVDGLLGHPLSPVTAPSTFPLSALMPGSICSVALSDLCLLSGPLSPLLLQRHTENNIKEERVNHTDAQGKRRRRVVKRNTTH